MSTASARLFFQDQSDAITAVVFLWERRLAGDHVYTPVTDFDVNEGDLNERIRGLFKLYIEKVLEGEVVKKLERKIEKLAVEIDKFTSFFKRPRRVRVYSENQAKKEAMRVEMEGVVKRVEEFRKGMRCLMDFIEGRENGGWGVLRVYDESNGRKMNFFYYWSRIHFLILREFRRVENGLPIYGFRSEILKMLHSQQV
ncbi:ATP-DEPENDENT RNA HELICASE DEAH12 CHLOROPLASTIC-LIKE [Salix koriyanagi]|uniref:ATP-DEPENDENT RNA HELICASE DEAH12 CHLOROPLASTIC-LIKE n=1 Tax=Salix koriyanagi TaxID=2511006 RepID=A0A9Q0PNL6_9ROSI|nr:ATP-DEPENDENT RNA HELICASE DEAH12 CHLOROPLASTIC-LIKE [Salix koriyanagi]